VDAGRLRALRTGLRAAAVRQRRRRRGRRRRRPRGGRGRRVRGRRRVVTEENVENVEQDATEPAVDPVEAVARERDEYLDALQRLKAEFDNYRKRVARDQQELAARAHERLVTELVPVLDDLERALEAAAEHEEAR